MLLLALTGATSVSLEAKCAYVVLLMAILWTFTPIPLPITSFLPVVLLPMLGISSTEKACAAYLKGSNMLFLGCLALALAVEKSNLHQRVALRVLLFVKAEFQLILLCFMLTTMFFSMWIVSTATVAMMLPIADEIFNNLFNVSFDETSRRNTRTSSQLTAEGVVVVDSRPEIIEPNGNGNGNGSAQVTPLRMVLNQQFDEMLPHQPTARRSRVAEAIDLLTEDDKVKICKHFCLCVAFSATFGSVSTLTANGPNLILKDILEKQFENRDPVDYASWLIFAAPASVLITLVAWFVYSRLYFSHIKISRTRQKQLRQHFNKKYEQLGAMTFHEVAVSVVFVIMILLYFFYKPPFGFGWHALFPDKTAALRPASAAILCLVLLFLIPRRPMWNPNLQQDALLDWHTIQTKLEWGVILIRGGGFAMADAVKSSGFSSIIGDKLALLEPYFPNRVLFTVFICAAVNVLIEFMRTSATASILLPVAINLSASLGLNPLKLAIPVALSCAYAFLSPVGTTANTIVYYHCNLSVKDMIIPGLIAKVISMTIMLSNSYLLGDLIFNTNDANAAWAANKTLAENATTLMLT